MNDSISDILGEMRRCGYKITDQRIAILQAFFTGDAHLSARQIYEYVQRLVPDMSLATVYRTIDILIEVGAVRRACIDPSGEEGVLYELSCSGEHHHHLVCVKCGKIMEFKGCNFQELARGLERLTAFEIHEHWLQAFGKCPDCK
jgi:Fur family ferric uptake transcriptional regulator